MLEIDSLIKDFLQALNETFAQRVWFVGLQGSYRRGEATENSDIDIVVILDEVAAADIQTYNTLLDSMPYRELFCGFLSGKNEILNWDTADLFQFYYDTKQIKGSLNELLPLIDEFAIDRAIKIGVCNIYHGCVHNMLYEKSNEILISLYKSASFVIQAIYFKQTGEYISSRKALINAVLPEDQIILKTFSYLKSGRTIDFQKLSENLFEWSKNRILK